ncbi:LuxR C-terminal-related transcriptional regulator (plasmid) [Hymenobacter tibetensis]|uniref:LuxR C-terminal-related transcriptional regulator n=1 Tax=Hymenobacter tibetensis TaxID=497967 RepID=A0ABY4D5U9_9BACT|nr:LuxR C-terminal-related transcriptional regulator [Hymenobacter tibetensis]UOG77427.1 LuxR C-terminal-related transcriptional regulator [Hymenobacter tibetensis]
MSLPAIPNVIAQVWRYSPLYNDPDAPPSAQAEALGRRIAESLPETQALYVGDHRAGVISYVSAGVERLLGYPADRFGMLAYDLIHPDDLPLVVEASVLTNRFVAEHRIGPRYDVVLSIDFRMRHAQGHWVRVLRQNFALVWEPRGGLVAVASLLTDITAHKLTNDVQFHLNLPGFADYVRQQQLSALPVALSRREREVALLVLQGLGSQAIATHLGVSVETVKTHRRNFHRKVGSHDLGRLLRHLRADEQMD